MTHADASPPSSPPGDSSIERHAVVRIDAQPGGKKFQGVWLEFADGQRWVIDYRPRALWRGFEGAEVIVTGACYRPFGQAIGATHYRVDRMRFASRPKNPVPYLEIGPARLLRGAFVSYTFPAGSKLGGSSRLEFSVDGGSTYAIAGSTDTLPGPGAVAVEARSVELDMSYAATTGGPQLWILAVHGADHAPDPHHGPTAMPCP